MRHLKIILFTALILCFFTTATVSAQESNFDDLNTTIANSGDNLYLDSDVVLNSDSSNEEVEYAHGILINKNLTIDGQGNTISATDGTNNIRIFNVQGDISLTLKNLILRDGSSEGGSAIFFNSTGTLTLVNVTFINNYATSYGGAVYMNSGDLVQNNTKYINNSAQTYSGAIMVVQGSILENNSYYLNNHAGSGGATTIMNGNLESYNSVYINNSAAATGGALFINQGITYLENLTAISNQANMASFARTGGLLTINKSKFINNTVDNFGMILIVNANALINNSNFINSTSAGSVADIYGTGANITVVNSNFTNSIAAESAGSIGFKTSGDLIIDNCIFNKTVAGKDGGAIFVDTGSLYINNSDFVNCHAIVGGAVTVIEGSINVNNSKFRNNSAQYNGGSVYVSFAGGSIDNSEFTGNYADEGGALYLDYSLNFNITDSDFTENKAATFGGAIHSNEGYNCISNNYFNNNTAVNGSALFSFYDNSLTLENNNFTNDSVSLNNTQLFYLITGEANELTLVNNTITLVNLPSRFDLRDFGWVTPIENQGAMSVCWTFGSLGALESALLKATNVTFNFSENNMKDIMLRYSKWGSISTTEYGNDFMTVAYLVSWMGPLINETETYDQLGKITGPYGETVIHVQDVLFIDPRENATDNDQIKWAIINYGAVETGFYYDTSYISNDTKSYYYNGEPNFNHIICIVGWDDTYSKNNFKNTPPGDGAFIIKNSWGESVGDGGYQYISYYDTSLARLTTSIAYIINNTVNYNKNYQYDFTGLSGFLNNNNSYVYYGTSFNSTGNDLIAGVGTYFDDDSNDYEVYIYVNGELKYSQSGTVNHAGYATIKLNEYIPVYEGDTFTAIIKSKNIPYMLSRSQGTETGIVSRLHLRENTSFISYDGENWTDFINYNATACLKIYTVSSSILSEDLTKYYRNGTQFIATVYDINGKPLANSTVGLIVNGVTYNRTSNENGQVSLNINLRPGNYEITVLNYATGENRTTNIEVLPTLITDDLIKYFRNGTQFEILVLDSHGNPIANKTVRININGVIYYRTSNENGIAVLNINLNPGEYVATVTDNETGLEVSNKVTVLPTILSSDLTKTYGIPDSFNVTVLDNHGNPIANKTVTFNVNGVIYHRVSDENGIARLNINLLSGKYIITSEYEDYRVSNTIIVEEAI